MNKLKRQAIFERFRAANPKPTTELVFHNNFQLLIAVLLSAQATDVSVNKAMEPVFCTVKTPQDLLNMGLERFTEAIKSIGLYKTKAKNALATAKILVDQYDGEVPNDREALESLPGVGRKTANVVLNTAFSEIAMAVDTHIFRVSNRTGIAKGKNVLEVEQKLLRLVPKTFLLDAHHWLILHGRYVCTARSPKCWQCGINDLCEFKEKQAHPAVRKSAAKKGVKKAVKQSVKRI
ncbi:Endonuclease III [Oligella sp. MSHR50489EDL]|uniref:endonuclease III n=1 Tax=Oligella sp. MSHR50489EDL TaxID=3139409 RepID=UPI003D81583B